MAVNSTERSKRSEATLSVFGQETGHRGHTGKSTQPGGTEVILVALIEYSFLPAWKIAIDFQSLRAVFVSAPPRFARSESMCRSHQMQGTCHKLRRSYGFLGDVLVKIGHSQLPAAWKRIESGWTVFIFCAIPETANCP